MTARLRNLPELTIVMMNVGVGGAQRAMVNLANRLAARGIIIKILAGERKGTYLGQLDDAVVVEEMGRSLLAMGRALLRENVRGADGVILVTQTKPMIVATAIKWLLRSKVRLVLREPNRLNSKPTNFGFALAGFSIPFLYKRSNHIIAVTQAIRDDLTAIGVNRNAVTVIPNGIDGEAIALRSVEHLSEPWFAEQSCPVLLAVGRLTHQKGFDDLLRAFALVRRDRQVKLIILGEGALRAQLLELAESLEIADYVRMPGFVENPYAYMSRANVFVLSSLWEGSPNALLEALACGCAVVATDCPTGPREIVTSPEVGKLVPVGDVSAMSEAILLQLDAENDRGRQIEFVNRQHGLEGWVRKYEEVLFSGVSEDGAENEE